ncbi:hypothetical protein B0H13DRAFT_2470961 [Mycena leptocephala]|nr:hypothetical protein B0H13DRAFT_2470961 [Mycena leptocephala]
MTDSIISAEEERGRKYPERAEVLTLGIRHRQWSQSITLGVCEDADVDADVDRHRLPSERQVSGDLSPLFFRTPTVSSTSHSYRTRTVFTLVPDLVLSVFMSYQHLSLNFKRSGHPGSAASSGTLSSGAAPTGARISIGLLNPGSSQQTHSAPSASSETRALAQQVAQLQTQINSMNASAPQLMFSDPAEIERVRAAAAATQSLPKKILTPVVPGHKSDALTTGKYLSVTSARCILLRPHVPSIPTVA